LMQDQSILWLSRQGLCPLAMALEPSPTWCSRSAPFCVWNLCFSEQGPTRVRRRPAGQGCSVDDFGTPSGTGCCGGSAIPAGKRFRAALFSAVHQGVLRASAFGRCDPLASLVLMRGNLQLGRCQHEGVGTIGRLVGRLDWCFGGRKRRLRDLFMFMAWLRFYVEAET
jgi:hypothetical protein